MTQVKDFANRAAPEPDDFLYLISKGNTDYKVFIATLLGELNKQIVEPFYELILDDQYHRIRMTFPGNKELTIPTNFDVPFIEGTTIRVRNGSSNLLTLIPATTAVEIKSKSGLVIPANGEIKLSYVGDDLWEASGDLQTV